LNVIGFGVPRSRWLAIARAACATALLSAAAASTAFAQSPPPAVLNDEQLLQKYVWSTLGGEGLGRAALVAGFDQWRGKPERWGPGWNGYGKRLLSEFGASAIGSTTKYGVAHVERQDPSFVRCTCTGFGPRLRHAVTSPFYARRRDGRRVFSLATVAGLTAENVIPAATWYPAARGTRGGLLHAGAGVAAEMGIDVFREFVFNHTHGPGRR
jgi:hypothetical protein